MELNTSTNNANAKQLFLKKKVVVKFISVTRIVKKGSAENRNDMQTTTTFTIPTTTIIQTNPY